MEIICADDIRGIEGQPNGCGLYGPYFFIGSDEEEEQEYRSLTEEEVSKCLRYWAARRHEAPPTPEEIRGSLRVVEIGSAEWEEHQRRQRAAEAEARASWDSL